MLTFRRMTEEEFQIYLDKNIQGYAQTLIRGRDLDPETARKEAEDAFCGPFPDGLQTKDQFVMFIEDVRSGKTVGEIWYGYEVEDGVRQVYLSEFLIYEEERRKGYASAALEEMERRAKADGCAVSALYVWDHNPAGCSLYRKCGYAAVSHGGGGSCMKKKL